MSVESFIRAMPKVDIHVQLEGALSRQIVTMIAEQTDAIARYKREKDYHQWLDLYENLNYSRLDEIAREVASWVSHPEDIARGVYDLGVQYSKQNVKYLEVLVIPAIYTDLDLTFQDVINALAEGADKARRGWDVRINWILAMPRERPRKSDDIARWATGASAEKNNVVGLGLVGVEDAQPIAQFRKAFTTAERKGLARLSHAYSSEDAEEFDKVLDVVSPTRLHDVWALLDDEAALRQVTEREIPIVVTPTREVRLGRIDAVAQYPIQQMLDAGVKVLIASGMPTLYGTTIADEYIALVQECGLSIEQIENLALDSVRYSLLDQADKTAMLDDFREQYATLKTEHLAEEQSE